MQSDSFERKKEKKRKKKAYGSDTSVECRERELEEIDEC